MKFATYIDGSPSTPFGVMLAQHSVSCSIKIDEKHRGAWEQFLEDCADVEIKYPVDRKKPVPVTLSTDQLLDLAEDAAEEEFVQPYIGEIRYMCDEDPCGMGVVYLMGRLA